MNLLNWKIWLIEIQNLSFETSSFSRPKFFWVSFELAQKVDWRTCIYERKSFQNNCYMDNAVFWKVLDIFDRDHAS